MDNNQKIPKKIGNLPNEDINIKSKKTLNKFFHSLNLMFKKDPNKKLNQKIKDYNQLGKEIIKLNEKIKNKIIEIPEKNKINNNLLFVITDENIEIYDGINEGIFTINGRDIEINSSKKRQIQIGEKFYSCYIADQNNRHCYPYEPVFDSIRIKMSQDTSTEIYQNLDKIRNKGNKQKEIMKWIVILIAVIFGGYILGSILDVFPLEKATEVVKQTIDANTSSLQTTIGLIGGFLKFKK